MAELRTRLGLSQTGLARQLGVSFSSVSRWERGRTTPSGAALRQLVRLEGAGIAATQGDVARSADQRSAQRQLDGSEGAAARKSNLPVPLTSFVGRADELEILVRLLAGTRLLTLTGTGGVGKTRLAIELARGRLAGYPGGTWWVELGALTDPALVAQTIAATLEVRLSAQRTLQDALHQKFGGRSALLVIDNGEHLTDTLTEIIGDLLRGVPALCIVATSRSPLRVDGEVTWRVPSLSLSAVGPTAAARPARSEAEQLFVARATAVEPGLALTADDDVAIGELCRRLDGIPLAIELAATRVRVLAPRQILARVVDRFSLLTGGSQTAPERHRTLSAAVGWSYGLLEAAERDLFNRLAVFSGGFTLAAVEAIAPPEGAQRTEGGANRNASIQASPPATVPAGSRLALDLLTGLVDKSLVVHERRGDEPCFRMLETLRQFAGDRLVASGELEEARRRHAAFFLQRAEVAGTELEGPHQATWVAQLEPELENIRAALTYLSSLDGSSDGALRLAVGLGIFWEIRGYYQEGRAWLERGLDRAAKGDTLVRARAVRLLGAFAIREGDLAEARQWLEQALRLWRALDDRRGEASSLNNLAILHHNLGDLATARARYDECAVVCEGLGDHSYRAMVVNNRGLVEVTAGNLATAAAYFDECVALSRTYGYSRWLAFGLMNLGWVRLKQGDHAGSIACCAECIHLCRDLGFRLVLGHAITVLAGVAYQQQRVTRAVRLFAASAALYAAIGVGHREPVLVEADRLVAELRTDLDDVVFASSWRDGQAMSLDDAVAYALAAESGVEAVPGADGSTSARTYARQPGPTADLTEREREVLRQLVEGRSNKEIAAALALSVRTVEHHASNIYAKLGVRGKAGAVARALQSDLADVAGIR